MTALDSQSLWHLLNGLRVTAQQCAQVARALQPLVRPEFKAPDSPHQTSTTVSLADRLCQELLILQALALLPGIQVYSEEMEACPASLRALFADNLGRYELVLDPIDGSEDYVAGRESYGIMLGLLDIETEQLVAALIHLPADDSTWCAVRGAGIRCAVGLSAPLLPLARPPVPKTLGRTKRLSDDDYAAVEAAGIQVAPAISRSCAVELVRLLRGELSVVAMRHFHGHDSAMGALLVQELGGCALDQAGDDVRYTPDMPRLPLVVLSLEPVLARATLQALTRNTT